MAMHASLLFILALTLGLAYFGKFGCGGKTDVNLVYWMVKDLVSFVVTCVIVGIMLNSSKRKKEVVAITRMTMTSVVSTTRLTLPTSLQSDSEYMHLDDEIQGSHEFA